MAIPCSSTKGGLSEAMRKFGTAAGQRIVFADEGRAKHADRLSALEGSQAVRPPGGSHLPSCDVCSLLEIDEYDSCVFAVTSTVFTL